ncbi:hypothetical protein [Hyphobacterium marinum]|uniref:Uncharacterized protein n=1 Tax=Hyphobacterium marinum TaxID=3116574 RepID=A0ABU7M0J6_9PROT|nr:hypothetical protein [Hyphobacterium sp. Y6023]MEE2567349.1 hypothetical protein [Hyphobacterium sp. Y6023]
MMFVFRAAFWIAVVSAFAPSALLGHGEANADAVVADAQDMTRQVTEFCDQAGAICEAGAEAGDFLDILADVAAVRVNRWLEEREAASTASDS